MLSERMLKKWRKDALKGIELDPNLDVFKQLQRFLVTFQERILQMTQELLDLHLLRKK